MTAPWANAYGQPCNSKADSGNLGKLLNNQVYDYVVQEHDARRAGLHHDLRFGNKDTGLYSWAVPKGIPDQGKKHLAVQQPLHRHSYGTFEGEIECVPPGTLINVPGGVRPIEELVPHGDEIEVLGVGSRGLAYYPVKRLYKDVRRTSWIRLDFETLDGKCDSLVCGPEHGIYVLGRGFVSAKDLSVDDTCISGYLSQPSLAFRVAGGAEKYEVGRMVAFADQERNKMVRRQPVSVATTSLSSCGILIANGSTSSDTSRGQSSSEGAITVTVSKVVRKEEFCKDEEALDLLVEDAHNYFANGVLVHNSGYGAGTVRLQDKGKIRLTKVLPGEIHFAREGSDSKFLLKQVDGKNWIVINTSPKPA